MERKIFLGGLGGQGIVFGGKLLGKAAVNAGLFATVYSEYAPAMRNGYTYTTMVLSEREVGAQVTACYDCMAFFDEDSCVKQSPCLKAGGCYIINTSLVKTVPESSQGTAYQIAASEMADELGNGRLLNIIMLGAIVEATPILNPDSVTEVIRETFQKQNQIAERNLRAFQRGIEAVKSQREKSGGRV